MNLAKLSLWTRCWFFVMLLFVIYPLLWLIMSLIQEKTLLYELPITFGFFFILILISSAIWGIGLWVKSKK